MASLLVSLLLHRHCHQVRVAPQAMEDARKGPRHSPMMIFALAAQLHRQSLTADTTSPTSTTTESWFSDSGCAMTLAWRCAALRTHFHVAHAQTSSIGNVTTQPRDVSRRDVTLSTSIVRLSDVNWQRMTKQRQGLGQTDTRAPHFESVSTTDQCKDDTPDTTVGQCCTPSPCPTREVPVDNAAAKCGDVKRAVATVDGDARTHDKRQRPSHQKHKARRGVLLSAFSQSSDRGSKRGGLHSRTKPWHRPRQQRYEPSPPLSSSSTTRASSVSLTDKKSTTAPQSWEAAAAASLVWAAHTILSCQSSCTPTEGGLRTPATSVGAEV